MVQMNTLFERGELEILETFDFLEELIEHTGLGKVLNSLESENIVIVVDDILIGFKVKDMKLEDWADGGVGFDKTHVVDYKNTSTIINWIFDELS